MQDPTPATAAAGGVAAEILVPLLAVLFAAAGAAVRGWLKARATQAWARTLLGAIEVAKGRAGEADAGPGVAAGVKAVTREIGRAVDWAPPAVQRIHARAIEAAGVNTSPILGPILEAARRAAGG